MTEALGKAIDKARSLPPEIQDRVAELIEQEFEQAEWRELVESPESLTLLDKLAEQARALERADQATPPRHFALRSFQTLEVDEPPEDIQQRAQRVQWYGVCRYRANPKEEIDQCPHNPYC